MKLYINNLCSNIIQLSKYVPKLVHNKDSDIVYGCYFGNVKKTINHSILLLVVTFNI